MTTPITEGLLTVPYVGLLEFQASPTWLDLQDLVEGGDTAQQNAEQYNQLLKASAWAENFCGQPLRAHVASESVRARVDKRGLLFLHPKNNPVRSITGIAYGADFQYLTVLTDLTQTWVEDQRGIVVSMLPWSGQFSTLQFGGASSPGSEVYVQFQYVAGYANTYLTAVAAAGSNTLAVADPTGFVPPQTSLFGGTFGGSVARIWEPGAEEAVAVSPGYVPGASPLVLSGTTANPHATGVQVSEFPAEVRQAVVSYTAGLLLREDASDDMPFAGSPGPVARRSGNRGVAGGLIEEAERLLMPYRRVR